MWKILFAILLAIVVLSVLCLVLMLIGSNKIDPGQRKQEDREQEAFCRMVEKGKGQ